MAGAVAAALHLWKGYTLYFGDAEAHLNIARRIFDSRTPGPFQLGTVWLPLPHLITMPFVWINAWWRSGLAGAIPSIACFVIAGLFLFSAVRRLFSPAPAWVALLAFALNPNILYLQSAPMTEAPFAAALMALLFAMVWFRDNGGMPAFLLAAVASNAASLTRYEGWFLIPFVALFFLWTAGPRWALGFGLLASAAPVSWLAHNYWYYNDPLEFYHGEWSAKAIYQRGLDAGYKRAPGDHDLRQAILQFSAAARLCAGYALTFAGLAGLAAAALRRLWWPAAFLALPPIFYVISLYSSGTPIYVPHMEPFSYYNTRYGLAALPLFAFGAAALAALFPGRSTKPAAVLVALTCILPWVFYPRAESWITWKEAEVNSQTRRQWTREAADYLRSHYRRGEGVFTAFGDQTAIFRQAGIPIAALLHDGNRPAWKAAVARPDLHLREHWAVAIKDDAVSVAVKKKQLRGTRYECVKIVSVPNSAPIEIYRRIHENSVYQGSRREE